MSTFLITDPITVQAVDASGEVVTRTYEAGTVTPADPIDELLLGLAYDGGVVTRDGEVADIATTETAADQADDATSAPTSKRARRAASTTQE